MTKTRFELKTFDYDTLEFLEENDEEKMKFFML